MYDRNDIFSTACRITAEHAAQYDQIPQEVKVAEIEGKLKKTRAQIKELNAQIRPLVTKKVPLLRQETCLCAKLRTLSKPQSFKPDHTARNSEEWER